ncbi:MAG TPA: dephospho-CoA kinase [Candidatus Dormibacteraeota bacterium]|nr:dephospho-CoA kinase [Candidatus Dormibacteraeota bacterium]
MVRVGLTGGIASGKSTVAGMLRDREYPVLDADSLGRELLEQGQDAYKEVVAHFGVGVLTPGGAVDRKKLAAIVFSDAQERAKLNQILHPRIRDVVANWFAMLNRPGGPELAFEDAALILESGGRGDLDRIVVCWCRPEQQLARLLERGLSEAHARSRIAAQMPIDEKRKLADEVIDCSGSMEETERQLDAVLEKLKRG